MGHLRLLTTQPFHFSVFSLSLALRLLNLFLSSPWSCPPAPRVTEGGCWHETGNVCQASVDMSHSSPTTRWRENRNPHEEWMKSHKFFWSILESHHRAPLQRLRSVHTTSGWWKNIKQTYTACNSRYSYFLLPHWSSVLWGRASACKQTCYSWALGQRRCNIRWRNALPDTHTHTHAANSHSHSVSLCLPQT